MFLWLFLDFFRLRCCLESSLWRPGCAWGRTRTRACAELARARGFSPREVGDRGIFARSVRVNQASAVEWSLVFLARTSSALATTPRQPCPIMNDVRSNHRHFSPPPFSPSCLPPPACARQISFLVSYKGSQLYGWPLASPDMLAIAALANWREGVVMGAARHLNAVRSSRKSMTPVC